MPTCVQTFASATILAACIVRLPAVAVVATVRPQTTVEKVRHTLAALVRMCKLFPFQSSQGGRRTRLAHDFGVDANNWFTGLIIQANPRALILLVQHRRDVELGYKSHGTQATPQ